MIAAEEFVVRARIDDVVLTSWIEAGWLRPNSDQTAQKFSEIDLARAAFIVQLERDMGLNDEGISVALDLVDQIHGVRRVLRELLEAVRAQPEETQSVILSAVRDARRK
jgi:chaperone modulatory protein CbpM